MSVAAVERDACARLASMRARMEDELAAWVAIPSGQGFAPGLARQRAALADRLRALGADLEDIACDPRPGWIDPPWQASSAAGADILLARRAGRGPRILLSGHFDTVHDPDGPFRALVAAGGGRATGPGAADMKGGLVIACAALEAIRDAGGDLAWSFVLVPDEESGSFGSDRALRSCAAGHAAGFALEPAGEGGTLVVERMGAGQFRIDAVGRAAHAGRDHARGVSAVRVLCERVLGAERLTSHEAGRIVNVGPLQGGAATNIVPERAHAWGNMRFSGETAQAELERGLDALASGGDHDVPRVRVQRIVGRPAKPLTSPVEHVVRIVEQAARDLGRPLARSGTGGVCDGNNLQAAGLPVLDTLGVRGGNLHRSDEWVDLDGLVDRAQLLAMALLRTAASPPPAS